MVSCGFTIDVQKKCSQSQLTYINELCHSKKHYFTIFSFNNHNHNTNHANNTIENNNNPANSNNKIISREYDY